MSPIMQAALITAVSHEIVCFATAGIVVVGIRRTTPAAAPRVGRHRHELLATQTQHHLDPRVVVAEAIKQQRKPIRFEQDRYRPQFVKGFLALKQPGDWDTTEPAANWAKTTRDAA